jgi:hypothetical protein
LHRDRSPSGLSCRRIGKLFVTHFRALFSLPHRVKLDRAGGWLRTQQLHRLSSIASTKQAGSGWKDFHCSRPAVGSSSPSARRTAGLRHGCQRPQPQTHRLNHG